jgi:hypothetical protein
MSIGNELLLDLLNGATTHVADVSTGAAQQLVVGGVYTLQALSADTYVGFGATSAAAIADGDSGSGEKLVADAPPRVFICTAQTVLFVGCEGGTLRVRRCVTP